MINKLFGKTNRPKVGKNSIITSYTVDHNGIEYEFVAIQDKGKIQITMSDEVELPNDFDIEELKMLIKQSLEQKKRAMLIA